MGPGMVLIVLTFILPREIEKTTLKWLFGICSVFITIIVVLNTCPLIICVVVLHKQVDEAELLCSKSQVNYCDNYNTHA